MAGGFRVWVNAGRALGLLRQTANSATLSEIGRRGASYLRQASIQSFARQADPVTGEAWKQSLRARRENGQTLMDTGRLRRLVDSAFTVTGSDVEVQGGVRTPLVYAAIHQFGGKRGRAGALPRRRYVGFTAEKFNAWVSAVRKLLERQ